MNKWVIVTVPLILCLALTDVVVRQFLADRAFSGARRELVDYEKQIVLYAMGRGPRPEPIASVGPLLKKAVKLEPRCGEYRNYLGRYYQHLAADLHLSGDRRMRLAGQALEQYEKAVKLDPLNGQYHAWLAYLQGALGDHEQAVANFEKAIRLDKSNGWIREVYEAYREGQWHPEEAPEAAAASDT
jgi:tetratricopeptide (TPR) repeat protein